MCMEKYKVDLQSNRINSDKNNCSILDKVLDYKIKVDVHETLGLNLIRKSPTVSICDREVLVHERHSNNTLKALMFGSNNYLGAIANEGVINKSIEATKEFGIGSGGVPILSGTTYYHDLLEKKLSQIYGFDDTMLFSSGFTANLGVILGLIRPNNLILQDKLNHASLIDGGLMSGAKMLRYKHNDPEDLNRILNQYHKGFPNGILVVTDGVFSMDGDIANLPELLEVTAKYNALLLIDEAHSTGVIGRKGYGTLSHHNITNRKNIIISGTLSKALGSVGGYISACQEIIDYLRIYARSNLYSTSLPPSVCASSLEVLNIMDNTNVVEKLNNNAKYLRNVLREKGYNILNTVTPIIPVIIGDEYKLSEISKYLLEQGIYTSYIQPPAVPLGTCRIRINVMESHTIEDMDYFVSVLDKANMMYNFKEAN